MARQELLLAQHTSVEPSSSQLVVAASHGNPAHAQLEGAVLMVSTDLSVVTVDAGVASARPDALAYKQMH